MVDQYHHEQFLVAAEYKSGFEMLWAFVEHRELIGGRRLSLLAIRVTAV